MSYPQSLAGALAELGVTPTGNVQWDQGLLQLYRHRRVEQAKEINAVGKIVELVEKENKRIRQSLPDLANPAVYNAHRDLLLYIANNIILAPQRRKYIVDENNGRILRFLLYYFNDCHLAEEVFPDRGYKLHKNILLQGGVGVGKTMMMQIFSEYLRRTGNPRAFFNVSVTQMVNHYSVYNNIDRFLYNVTDTKTLQGKPFNLCLNDIGVDNRPFYGIDTLTIVNDFLHARNEIWSNGEYDRKFAHLTTNLSIEQLETKFKQKDGYGRIIDRFKTYNVIPLVGSSRR